MYVFVSIFVVEKVCSWGPAFCGDVGLLYVHVWWFVWVAYLTKPKKLTTKPDKSKTYLNPWETTRPHKNK